MPRPRASGVSDRIKLEAPRILKAPPRCRFSHLKKARVPAAASKPAEVITGVLRARGRIRSAAARTSFASIARAILLSLARFHLRDRLRPAAGCLAGPGESPSPVNAP